MKKLKTSIIVWVAIYPTITVIQYFFGDILVELPLAVRTLILTAVLVPSMVYLLIPFWTKVFERFNNNKKEDESYIDKSQHEIKKRKSKRKSFHILKRVI